MLLSHLLFFAAAVQAVDLDGYEYIVVGAGAAGGPLAARLAIAGRKTLLIEAGDDQASNVNYTVPAFSALASEDPKMSWDFFVRFYSDDEQQKKNHKTTYETPDGALYTGLNPPPGSSIKGVLYPRVGALGGCTAHHAQIQIYPYRSDFEDLATLTGDESWDPDNVRRYYVGLEDNNHLLPLLPGHGYNGWLGVDTAPLTLVLQDTQLLSLILGGAFALGNKTDHIFNLVTLLAGDANAARESRDKNPGFYQMPLSVRDGKRNGARDFVVSVRDARNSDGSKRYPLDVRTNCHVTKVIFDETVSPPRAIGVEFLDGAHLYRASPLAGDAAPGVPGTARASREVIISGGAFNSPQILKLSGIGPADELEEFGIPVIVDLPGVGTNLQDHYEVSVVGQAPSDFALLDGCTFNLEGEDPCLRRWQNPNILGDRGVYQTSGASAALLYPTSVSAKGDFDIFLFATVGQFAGYYPGYSVDAVAEHNRLSWAVLKGQPRSSAGYVKLRSADPLDTPDIVFEFFKDGGEEDLQALYEGILLARDAFDRQLVDVEEQLPGAEVESEEDIKAFIRNTAWGHHASSTCPIGTDDDPMAVLDSKFRVRGVTGLRVVDASSFPEIPGTYTAASTYVLGEKAAGDILSELRRRDL
ncbi:choline dehydrogenase [Stachybotrys elegans]|uniref:Choline dehydrogenase n=1 Tax=Stachybotrys elegans TaxID=80388 RepID=A0A8K0SS69_9HYPO|nr:choline dehydrogenase [Stachybotrys elegans]